MTLAVMLSDHIQSLGDISPAPHVRRNSAPRRHPHQAAKIKPAHASCQNAVFRERVSAAHTEAENDQRPTLDEEIDGEKQAEDP